MNFMLIFRMSLLGLLISYCSVFWLPTNTQPYIWLMAYLIWGYILAERFEKRYFLQGFILCVFNTIWETIVIILDYKSYVTHHDELTKWNRDLPPGMDPCAALLIVKDIPGLVSFLLPGSFAYIISRIRNK